jgi:hypothetical protein
MTSNIELMKFISYFNLMKKYCFGIISKDDFELYSNDVYYQIINLDSKNNPGTHWVMIIKCFNMVYYFDSYGMKPFQRLVDYCKEYNIILYYNIKRIQIDNYSCGFHCLKIIIDNFLSSDHVW